MLQNFGDPDWSCPSRAERTFVHLEDLLQNEIATFELANSHLEVVVFLRPLLIGGVTKMKSILFSLSN